jgi:spermidine synthase
LQALNSVSLRLSLATFLIALSGFSGLGYQVFFAQKFSTWLGHEMVAVLSIVAAVFAGIAAGSWALGKRIQGSAFPGRWYAACEAVIALWSLVLVTHLDTANIWLAVKTGAAPSIWWQWSLAFFGPLLLLSPITLAMGATVPAIERLLQSNARSGYRIGLIYGANTLGAVIGVLSTALFFIPNLGLTKTALICVAASSVCAIGAGFLFHERISDHQPEKSIKYQSSARLLSTLFLTGLLGIGFEVTVVRVLSQVTQNTVYTFSIFLAIYLLATAAGAFLYQRWTKKAHDQTIALTSLLLYLAGATTVSLLVLSQSPIAVATLSKILSQDAAITFNASLLAEAIFASLAFTAPCVGMGALFSHLCVMAKNKGWPLGSAIGVNTLGATLAPLLFGVTLLPLLGTKLLLAAIAVSYLGVLYSHLPEGSRITPIGTGALAAIACLVAILPNFGFVDLPKNGRLISQQDGVMATVSVVESSSGIKTLRINNREQEGSSSTALTDARLAWLPLLLHHQPRNALFLGLGTGVTAQAAARQADFTVDAIELIPEVISASAHFVNGEIRRPNIIAADARRYVRASNRQYDIIISDLFHPARQGSGALYTVEHFAAVRERLGENGIFCQWLPLHQLDKATLKSIVSSFMKIYPQAVGMLANNSLDTPVIGLIGTPGNMPDFHLPTVKARLEAFALNSVQKDRLGAMQISDEFALIGSMVAGPSALREFSRGAELNTDDRPIINQLAPRVIGTESALVRHQLIALMSNLRVDSQQILSASSETSDHSRLGAYWEARKQFLATGVSVKQSNDVKTMLAQIQQPLMKIVKTSADFRPAYDPLLNMSKVLATADPKAAQNLLRQLTENNPNRTEAAELAEKINASSIK